LGDAIADGIAVTKYDHALPLQKIKIFEAGHPVPDEKSIEAGAAILHTVKNLTPKDIVITLISGGASALMADAPTGVLLQHLQQTIQLLLESGATIHEINTVRKHLSNIKGGWLAVHVQPAKLFSLILSDVVGDDLDIIASGPTVADSSTFADAAAVLNRFKLMDAIPFSVKQHFINGLCGNIADTPKQDHPAFGNTFNMIIGSNKIALQAAKDKALALGYQTTILSSAKTGEAKEVAKEFVYNLKRQSWQQPACLLMGGETTVTVKGNGKGGRNQEFALAAVMELPAEDNITVLSGGTDGTDGPTDAAGAVVDATTLLSAKHKKLDLKTFLENNDAYHFFEQAGGLIKTGPTQTNVMDVMIGLFVP
jgi:glycerate 2-kinase